MQKWIELTMREMDDDEKERYAEFYSVSDLEFVEERMIFDCPLPDDGQEVLISVNGEVTLDTFERDGNDGCYFEYADIELVDAWMPKPEGFKRGAE